jgi:hypothetical protein
VSGFHPFLADDLVLVMFVVYFIGHITH